MGRPTKLTPEVQATIVEALQAGNYAETAATLAGINNDSYYEWLKKGANGIEPYAAFSDAVKKASAEAERDSLASVRAQTEQWQASAWFLERRFPAKFSRRDPDYDLKTKLLIAELKTLKAKLKLLEAGVDPDAVKAELHIHSDAIEE